MRVIGFIFLFVMMTLRAEAVDIQRIETNVGVEVWLVESHALPMVSIQTAFRAGSAFDAVEHAGLAQLTATLLTEGAGRKKDKAYKQALENIGAVVSTGIDKLTSQVALKTLSEHLDDAFELYALAMTKPRFDAPAFARVQEATLAGIKHREETPGGVVGRLFDEHVYRGHPYAQPTAGYRETVSTLTRRAVKDFYRTHYTRANMVMSVVGDVDAQTVRALVEKHFKRLPHGEGRLRVAQAPKPHGPLLVRYEMNVPQSHILLGMNGITRHDPDYFAAYAMNYVLGGGGFNSRLMEELREKRGLTYGVYSYLEPLPGRGEYIASIQTKNPDVPKAISLMKKEIQRMATSGVSQKEYDGAMAYMEGSFPLRLDSNDKILNYLSVMQMENLGADYLATWVDKVKAITRADMQRVAKRLLDTDNLAVVVVGGE